MNTATTIQPRSMNFMFFASLVTLACIMSSGRADAQSAQVLTKTVSYDVRTLSTESAVLKINSPLVSALHNQSSGRGGAS